MEKKKYRHHSTQFKEQVVKENMGGMSQREIAIKYQLSKENIWKWVNRYLESGVAGLENKKRGRIKGLPGGALPKFGNELEQLKYENARLQMEVLRLKKLDTYLRGDAMLKNKSRHK